MAGVPVAPAPSAKAGDRPVTPSATLSPVGYHPGPKSLVHAPIKRLLISRTLKPEKVITKQQLIYCPNQDLLYRT